MKKVFMKTFGKLLMGRDDGANALIAFRQQHGSDLTDSSVFFDFQDVPVLAPSFGDEFFTPLEQEYPGKIIIDNKINLAVRKAFETIEQTQKIKFTFAEFDTSTTQ